MLTRSLLAAVNHVLASEDWAPSRLAKFAGQSVSVGFGSLSLAFTISARGLLEKGVATPDTPATVTLTLPDDAPARFLANPTSLLSAAQIAGSADLAETLGFVIRHLRWDVESDLSLLLGDIVGRRTAQILKALDKWQRNAAGNGLLGVGEWLSEESGLVAARRDVERFCLNVDALHEDCRRLESRLQRVESVGCPD